MSRLSASLETSPTSKAAEEVGLPLSHDEMWLSPIGVLSAIYWSASLLMLDLTSLGFGLLTPRSKTETKSNLSL